MANIITMKCYLNGFIHTEIEKVSIHKKISPSELAFTVIGIPRDLYIVFYYLVFIQKCSE